MSQIQLLYSHLRRHAGSWVPMPELVRVTGSYVIHSRIADLRRWKVGTFDNYVRHEQDGNRRTIHSFYRFTPNPTPLKP
jgi:hypothetical protein